MPAFQTPLASGSIKRKSGYDETNLPVNKRQAVSGDNDVHGVASGPRSFWMVQWYGAD